MVLELNAVHGDPQSFLLRTIAPRVLHGQLEHPQARLHHAQLERGPRHRELDLQGGLEVSNLVGIGYSCYNNTTLNLDCRASLKEAL